MTKRIRCLAAPLLAPLFWIAGCHPVVVQDKADAGAANPSSGSSFSCYIASQFTCNDYPNPTPEQRNDAPIGCSAGSGEWKEPAACPHEGFKGKCNRADGPTVPGPYVERFYAGADLVYAADFCVNTAKGVWSTTY